MDNAVNNKSPRVERINELIVSAIARAEGYIPLGDILDQVKANEGPYAMNIAICELWRMSDDREITIVEDNEIMRVTVQSNQDLQQ